MFGPLLAAAASELTALRQRALKTLIGLVMALAGAIIMLVALLSALFVAVAYEWGKGPLLGHLAVAGVACLVMVVALVIAFARPPKRPANPVVANIRSASSASAQAFDAARAAGEQARGLGAKVAALATGSRKDGAPPVSRKTLANATLGAVILGLFLGRRF